MWPLHAVQSAITQASSRDFLRLSAAEGIFEFVELAVTEEQAKKCKCDKDVVEYVREG